MVPERTALPGKTASGVSGFAGCGRRPSPSGFNTARQLPLRANEWQLFLDNCNQGGTACDTSLADRCKGLLFFGKGERKWLILRKMKDFQH